MSGTIEEIAVEVGARVTTGRLIARLDAPVDGLLPLWFGGGPMWEPMVISIIFGLVFATGLTLGFVPALYSIFFGVKYKGFKYETEGRAS